MRQRWYVWVLLRRILNSILDRRRHREWRIPRSARGGVLMHAAELRVGHVYALPTDQGSWCRHAAPVRVMSRGPRGRVLVLATEGVVPTPLREAVPRGALVWIDAETVACPWREWPARAATAREHVLVAVSSAVAAIGGEGAQVLGSSGRSESSVDGALARARIALNRWARPEPRLHQEADASW